MKKIALPFLLLLFVLQVNAASFYDQLCYFNFNWKKYAMRAPAGEARIFHSDREFIQAHLASVLTILRSNPTDQLSAAQYRSRMHLINVLDGYRAAGNFPMNYYRPERIPVFIDEHETHCAVGYLMQQTGHEALAQRIAAANNYAWVKDIHDPELGDWQQASGFTVEELKLIQGAYDSYRWDAFIAPDKYETPQKPVVIVAYFDNRMTGKPLPKTAENIWCKGEGANGILNGKWVQNYDVGLPWIVGYYVNNERSGQWKEYFQGTKKICRTENWRNNKLNGLRKRYDMEGNLIEEILFKDGKAVTKTNYSFEDSLVYIRRPLDSTRVHTEIYDFGGTIIAMGNELIHNPGNLLWFQNIQLTALNSASIQARDISTLNQTGGYVTGGAQPSIYLSLYGGMRSPVYYSPPLVQYKKDGTWTYYREYDYLGRKFTPSLHHMLRANYNHYGNALVDALRPFDDVTIRTIYDSVKVDFKNDALCDFYGYGRNDFIHLELRYYTESAPGISLQPHVTYYGGEEEAPAPAVKTCGEVNQMDQKIGEWKEFTPDGLLFRKVTYLIPWKEDDDAVAHTALH